MINQSYCPTRYLIVKDLLPATSFPLARLTNICYRIKKVNSFFQKTCTKENPSPLTQRDGLLDDTKGKVKNFFEGN